MSLIRNPNLASNGHDILLCYYILLVSKSEKLSLYVNTSYSNMFCPHSYPSEENFQEVTEHRIAPK